MTMMGKERLADDEALDMTVDDREIVVLTEEVIVNNRLGIMERERKALETD